METQMIMTFCHYTPMLREWLLSSQVKVPSPTNLVVQSEEKFIVL